MNSVFIDWDADLKTTKRYIAADPQAKRAFELLIQKGCEEHLVLQNLFLYCGADPQAIRLVKKQFIWGRQRIPAICRQLFEAADNIESVTAFFADLGIEIDPIETSVLRRYAQCLQRVGDVVVKKVASNRTSGRDQHLVFLHEVIVRSTGRGHHKELAVLIDAVAKGYGYETSATRDAEDIRKLIGRTTMLDLAGELNQIEDKRQKSSKR